MNRDLEKIFKTLENNLKKNKQSTTFYRVWNISSDNKCSGTVFWCDDMWGYFHAKFDENFNITDFKIDE